MADPSKNRSTVTWAFIVLWLLALVTPGGWTFPASVPARAALTLLVLWFLANFYVWFSPTLRLTLVQRRGPLLGFGFAFAAALLSSVVDGLTVGFIQGVGLFFWRLLLFSLPFALPFILKPTPYPHHLDLGVLVYALALPHLPGFTGYWTTLGEVAHPGLFGPPVDGGAVLGVGTLGSLALVGTYFYATRSWSAAPLDLRLRAGDLIHSGRTAIYALVGWFAAIGVWALSSGKSFAAILAAHLPASALFGRGGLADGYTHLLMAVGLAALVEALIFRGILQSGWQYWYKRRGTGVPNSPTPLIGAVIAALVHAAVGVYGLAGLPALGLTLGLTLAYRRIGRLLPAATGHALALFALGLFGLIVHTVR